jgi:hypothetical protein
MYSNLNTNEFKCVLYGTVNYTIISYIYIMLY